MPTRNRASLLQYALKSAQAQEFDDFEILVSNNFSSDETKNIVLDSLDNHTRYITTDRPLAMPDHWEFALAHAKGEYIFYLCDDDALRPDLLDFLFKVFKKKNPYCISWMNANYIHLDWYDISMRNSLRWSVYSNRLSEYNSSTLLTYYFNANGMDKDLIKMPKLLNSCCRLELLNKINSIAGKTFLPPSPDQSVAVATLALIPGLLHIESPLHLAGASSIAVGANGWRQSDAVKAFWEEFGEHTDLFLYTPLKYRFDPNAFFASILRVKAAMPNQLSHFSLNLMNYFIACWKGIEETRKYGNNVTAEVDEFYEVLDKQDKDIRDSVLLAIETDMQQRYESEKYNKPKEYQKNILGRLKNKLPAKMKERLSEIRQDIFSISIKKNKKHLTLSPGRIYGSEAGFSNIAECAIKMKEMFPLPEIE